MKSIRKENKYKIYYENEYKELHRIDGPAEEYHDGDKYFYLFDELYTETQHQYTIEHYHDLIESNEYFGQESKIK